MGFLRSFRRLAIALLASAAATADPPRETAPPAVPDQGSAEERPTVLLSIDRRSLTAALAQAQADVVRIRVEVDDSGNRERAGASARGAREMLSALYRHRSGNAAPERP